MSGILCYIGIGSNLGDRLGYIGRAIDRLKNTDGVKLTRASSIYETEPVSDIPQGKYMNAVLELETVLSPEALIATLNMIESELGRTRAVRNEPRVIDLDILYYGDRNIESPGLVIPHPRIKEREFVLKGLRELGRE
ncbi:MAG: 2-amino-4-hydroxy-6-hydroxymethyldihydropteridine diphosphokinase [Candidatus Omnitrophota bacterium]|jgi:2-amino-4-hydroxy-6-hydroxymethyldihydropteridine diphosphokinase